MLGCPCCSPVFPVKIALSTIFLSWWKQKHLSFVLNSHVHQSAQSQRRKSSMFQFWKAITWTRISRRCKDSKGWENCVTSWSKEGFSFWGFWIMLQQLPWAMRRTWPLQSQESVERLLLQRTTSWRQGNCSAYCRGYWVLRLLALGDLP